MDKLIKALAFNDEARIYLVNTTELIQKQKEKINILPTSLAALGRTLSCTLMMGSMLKNNETISIIINGNGTIGKIHADANSHGMVRGFVSNPYLYEIKENPYKLDVGKIVGTNGYLSVTKDLHLKEKFTSSVELQTGEIAEDFAYYFAYSEQIPTVVNLGVLVDNFGNCLSSGGFIIQLLPNATDEIIKKIENAIKNLEPISNLLTKLSLNDILKLITNNDYKVLDEIPVCYKCECSKDRFMKSLITLSKNDLDEIFTDELVETTCEYCKTKYIISKNEFIKYKGE